MLSSLVFPFAIFVSIISVFPYARGQISVFPTQLEQVNLLTNVQELFEQIKQSANTEQTAMDKAMKADLEITTKHSIYFISTLEELTIMKLTSRINAVCVFDAKDDIENFTSQAFNKLTECEKIGADSLLKVSTNLTNLVESAIKTGEEFLDKLNSCSEKRGFAVIACYRNIIQNDVLPVKRLLAEAIESHQKGHLKAFEIKATFNQCVEGVNSDLKDRLDVALTAGLSCT